VSTAPGHKGQLVFGTLEGQNVAVMQGRMHHYEGYSYEEVAYAVRVLRLLGCDTLIVTNAAGCINLEWKAGELMLITDHINFMGANPLRGENDDAIGPRFCDMTHVYTPEFQQTARQVAAQQGITLREGVYLGYMGPSFETPAEIRAFRTLGADAVGMSTVPEAIAASHCGLPVLGVSLITNMAAGMAGKRLSGDEVIEIANQRGPVFQDFIRTVVGALPL